MKVCKCFILTDANVFLLLLGDRILLTSSDYRWFHAEERTIKEITGPHTLKLSGIVPSCGILLIFVFHIQFVL